MMSPIKSQAKWLPLLFAIMFMLPACKNSSFKARKASLKLLQGKHELFTANEAHGMLSAAFPFGDTGKRNKTIPQAMAQVYAGSDYTPIWVAEDGLTDEAEQLLADLDSMQADGLHPERYNLPALKASFERLQKEANTAGAVAFDTSCTHAYLQASHDLLFGVLVPRKADSLWYHSNDSSWSAPQLLTAMTREGGKYPSLSQFRSAIPTYSILRAEYQRWKSLAADAALRSLKQAAASRTITDSGIVALTQKELPWFQPQANDSVPAVKQAYQSLRDYFGILPAKKSDSTSRMLLTMAPDTVAQFLAANMERLRWLPRSLEDQYVLVNIPLMELFYRKDGNDAFHMRVVVGRPSRQTPVLNAALANVVFSPSWGVPPTIMKKDVLPGIAKNGSRYLAKKGLRVYTRKGKPVSPSSINAENYKQFMLKQPPGDDNALGDVKFNFPNPWDIYLHDTPHREDFPKPYRAKSSGCIRAEKPREFAEFILKDIEGKDRFDQFTIDSIIQTRKTRWEILKNKIPIHVVYLTAMEDSTGSHARLVQDIYGRDTKLVAMLNEQ